MGVLSSSSASVQALDDARRCFMANRDSLLICAKPLEELLEPLDLHTLRNSYWDLAAFWAATLAGLAMGGAAAFGKAVINKAVQCW